MAKKKSKKTKKSKKVINEGTKRVYCGVCDEYHSRALMNFDR